jgi:hypothetical protein
MNKTQIKKYNDDKLDQIYHILEQNVRNYRTVTEVMQLVYQVKKSAELQIPKYGTVILPQKTVNQILALDGKLSKRQIAKIFNISDTTIHKYVKKIN